MKERFLIAAVNGDLNTLKECLLTNRELLETTDKEGNTALCLAIINGKEEAVALLIKEGANLNAADKYEGDTPLHHAIFNNQFSIAKQLIESGADINKKNNESDTPLHFAINSESEHLNEKSKLQFVTLLINAHADLNSQNENNETPLKVALMNELPPIAEILMMNGCNVDGYLTLIESSLSNLSVKEKNRHFNQMIHIASYFGYKDIIEFLIKSNANLNCVNSINQTPLIIATSNNQIEVVKMLVAAGADTSLADINNWRPIHYAAVDNNVSMIEVLNVGSEKINIEQFLIRRRLSYVFNKSLTDVPAGSNSLKGGIIENESIPLLISALTIQQSNTNVPEEIKIISEVIHLLKSFSQTTKSSTIKDSKEPLFLATGAIGHIVPAYMQFENNEWSLSLYERGGFWHRLNILTSRGHSATKMTVPAEKLPLVIDELRHAKSSQLEEADKILFDYLPTLTGNKFSAVRGVYQKPYKTDTCFYSNTMSFILHQFIKIGLKPGTILYKKLDIIAHEIVLDDYKRFSRNHTDLEPNAKQLIERAEQEILAKKDKLKSFMQPFDTMPNNDKEINERKENESDDKKCSLM